MSLLRNVPEHPLLSIALYILTPYIVLFSRTDRSDQMQTRLWGHNLESEPTQMWFVCAVSAVLDDSVGGKGAGYLGQCCE